MTFAVVTNLATMILCVAVLVQAVRLMRALDTIKGGALTEVVDTLERSTGEARRVLGNLGELLRGDVALTARTLSEGKAMLEELTVMTGIANAVAERIVEAAGATNRAGALHAVPPQPASSQRTRRTTRPRSDADAGSAAVDPLPTTRRQPQSAAGDLSVAAA